MKRVLIDTDVILDFFFDRKPFSDDAAKVLSLCESKEIQGFVTSVIISNIYFLLRQSSAHERVIEKLKQIITFIDVLVTDREVVVKALNSNFRDFEDALQNYSAESDGQIDVIITRNSKDFKNSSLGIMTPGNYLKTIVAARETI
jgi:predicted nucleic acid-binding protein